MSLLLNSRKMLPTNTYNTNIKPSNSAGSNDSSGGGLKVQIRGDQVRNFDPDEIRAKVRSSGLSAGQVNTVVRKTEEWAKNASSDDKIDYRELNKKIEENLSNEDPRAGAKYSARHGGDSF